MDHARLEKRVVRDFRKRTKRGSKLADDELCVLSTGVIKMHKRLFSAALSTSTFMDYTDDFTCG